MVLLCRCFLGLLLFSVSLTGHAYGFAYEFKTTVLDREISTLIPKGYCEVPLTHEHVKFYDEIFGSSVKILHFAGHCDEVALLLAGKTNFLKHHIAIEQIGIDGAFIRFLMGKLAYVTMITAFKANLQKIEKNVSEDTAPLGFTVSNMDYHVKSKTGSYVFFEAEAIKNFPKNKVPMHFYAYTSLIFSIPMAVHVYDEDVSHDNLVFSYATLHNLIKYL